MNNPAKYLPILWGEQPLILDDRPSQKDLKLAAEIILEKSNIRNYLKNWAASSLEQIILEPNLREEIKQILTEHQADLLDRRLLKEISLDSQTQLRPGVVEQTLKLLKTHYFIGVAGLQLQKIELRYFSHPKILEKLNAIREDQNRLNQELEKISSLKPKLELFADKLLEDIPTETRAELSGIKVLPELTQTGLEKITVILDELDLIQALIEIYLGIPAPVQNT